MTKALSKVKSASLVKEASGHYGKDRPEVRTKPGGSSVVSGFMRSSISGTTEVTPVALIESLKAGLPVRELDDLQMNLDVPMEKLAPMLGISKATLHRRKLAGKLDVAESDRVVRYARLLGMAAGVMESIENGRRWLGSPQLGLGGAVPLEYAETEVGAREVESLLGRIEYGVFS